MLPVSGVVGAEPHFLFCRCFPPQGLRTRRLTAWLHVQGLAMRDSSWVLPLSNSDNRWSSPASQGTATHCMGFGETPLMAASSGVLSAAEGSQNFLFHCSKCSNVLLWLADDTVSAGPLLPRVFVQCSHDPTPAFTLPMSSPVQQAPLSHQPWLRNLPHQSQDIFQREPSCLGAASQMGSPWTSKARPESLTGEGWGQQL